MTDSYVHLSGFNSFGLNSRWPLCNSRQKPLHLFPQVRNRPAIA